MGRIYAFKSGDSDTIRIDEDGDIIQEGAVVVYGSDIPEFIEFLQDVVSSQKGDNE